MTVLNPEEIDALLHAMKDAPPEDVPLLSPAPSFAFAMPTMPEEPAPTSRPSPRPSPVTNVKPYALVQGDRDLPRAAPVLEARLAEAARAFAASFGARARARVTSAATAPRAMVLRDVVVANSASVVGVIGCGTDAHRGLVLVDAPESRGLISALLGAADPARDALPAGQVPIHFTRVERQVLHRLFSLVTEALGTALGPHLIGWPELLGVEIDPWAAVQRGGDAVAVASLELKGALSAQIDVALPIAWLRPTARPVRPTQTIEHALDAVELPVRVVLGGARRTLREVLALQVGDLVLLDSTESAPLSVAIGDRAKWHGRATRKGANHAVIVDGAIAREPPVR